MKGHILTFRYLNILYRFKITRFDNNRKEIQCFLKSFSCSAVVVVSACIFKILT